MQVSAAQGIPSTQGCGEPASPLRRPLAPWLTTEESLLRQHYPKLGAVGVQREHMPNRTLASIRGKASEMKVRCYMNGTTGKRFARVHPPRDDIDMQIREAYIHATERGFMAKLAQRLGKPAWWVQKRAARLGVTRPMRVDVWTLRELDILEEWAHAGNPVIRAKLAAAGFKRTDGAIGIQLKRRDIDRTNPDVWTATSVAPLFGVNPATVADWVERRGLKAKRVSWGPNGKLLITRADLKRWVNTNRAHVDLRRVDQHWFLELMLGPCPKLAQMGMAA